MKTGQQLVRVSRAVPKCAEAYDPVGLCGLLSSPGPSTAVFTEVLIQHSPLMQQQLRRGSYVMSALPSWSALSYHVEVVLARLMHCTPYPTAIATAL
jgi:hypothetical protein